MLPRRFLSNIVLLFTNFCWSTVFPWTPSEKTCERIKESTCYTSSIYCNNLNPEELIFGVPLYEVLLNRTHRNAILRLHNKMRQEIACGSSKTSRWRSEFPAAARMGAVVWDGELEWGAYNLAKTCSFSKNCAATESHLYAGQSRFVAEYGNSSFSDSFKEMFQILYRMRNNFDSSLERYNSMDDYRDFTQVINDDTDRVGCASFVCSPKTKLTSLLYVVCNYNNDIIFSNYVYRSAQISKKPGGECLKIDKTYNCLCENLYEQSLWQRKETKGNNAYKIERSSLFSFIYFIYLEVVLNLS